MPAQQNNMLIIHSRGDAVAFVKAYNTAKSSYKTEFMFKDRLIVVSYAYYTIEYLVMSKYITGEFDKDKKFILS